MSEHASEERDLRAALQHAVAQICLEEEMLDDSAQMSTQAVAALSELVYQYATNCLFNDLLAFSRHANRRTITLEDVLLVARKDPQGLQAKLTAFDEKEKLSTNSRKDAKSTPKVSSSKKKKKKDDNEPLTQRMKDLKQRLKNIDSFEEENSESDEEMVDKPQAGKSTSLALCVDDSDGDETGGKNGKENREQATAKAKMSDEDVFASSEEDIAATTGPLIKKTAVVEFPPGGTKSGFSSDSSDDNMFADD